MSGRGNLLNPNHGSSRACLLDAFQLATAMANSEDTVPEPSTYPYSWAPDSEVTLDDFLKKVCTRCFLTNLIVDARWSAETLNGGG